MLYVYIHGFNSGKESRSGKELANVLNERVFCPECDYSMDCKRCLRNLSESIMALGEQEYCILGASLGGFYALQLRFKGIKKVIAWNPVIFPSLQLAPFVGKNKRFTDGKSWDFSKKSLYSYAEAPDPRSWENFYWQNLGERENAQPDRRIILGDEDELLDTTLAFSFWQNHAHIRFVHEGHRIMDYGHVLAEL